MSYDHVFHVKCVANKITNTVGNVEYIFTLHWNEVIVFIYKEDSDRMGH